MGLDVFDIQCSIEKTFDVPVAIDTLALEDAALDSETPVTVHVSGITLRSAVRLLLEPLQLTYVVRDDTLQITTVEEAEHAIRTGVYPVADLVDTRTDSGKVEADFDSLIEVITSIAAPDTWDEVGGHGSVSAFEASRALVIS